MKYSLEQIRSIRFAMEIATDLMHKKIAKRKPGGSTDYDAEDYAERFIAAGGLQIPGEPENATAVRLLSRLLLLALNPRCTQQINDDDVLRESARIRQELNRIQSLSMPNAVGFRLVADPHPVDAHYCALLIGHDRHGLGPGVWPKEEVVILQPGADRSYWEIVFADEIPQRAT